MLLSGEEAEIETRIVRSNTGYPLHEVIQGLEADLLVVRALPDKQGGALPLHMDWLYQVIPTRLLVAKDAGTKPKVDQNQEFLCFGEPITFLEDTKSVGFHA